MSKQRHETVNINTLKDELQDALDSGQYDPVQARIVHETLGDLRSILAKHPHPERARLDGRTVNAVRALICRVRVHLTEDADIDAG